jgi:hypothetical protein
MPIKMRKENMARVWRKMSSEPVANSNSFFTKEFGFTNMLIEKTCPKCIRLLVIDFYYAKSESKRLNKIPTHPIHDFEAVCIDCWDNRKKEKEEEISSLPV